MRSFIKIVFGSCLGVIVAILVISLIASLFTASFISMGGEKTTVKRNSVLKISFNQVIPQKTNNTEANFFNLSDDPLLGQYDIIESIKAAKEDRDIKGIYLQLSMRGMGNAKAHDIRDALVDFRESGKFIYAYCDNYGYGQGAYYMASAADQLYIHPLGGIDLRGFGAEIPFFKDMLDKLGIRMATFYAGKYKGATEPYRLNKMSEENRSQIKEYLTELYDTFINDLAEGRNMSPEALRLAASNLSGRNAKLALENGLVDGILYEDEVMDKIREALDLDSEEKISMLDLVDYHQSRDKERNIGAPAKIAILYAEGEIRAGEETYGTITDQHYVEMIREIGKDDKIRSVVLRVNSPGGDAYVSDEIWRELELLQEKDIKVVVSMGDVAASGGYYIACGADKILAEPNTITGSIGVFGIIPNLEELMNDKLGIHMDTVKTAPYATGVVSAFYPIGEKEASIVQEGVDRTYEVFLSRVAEGRGMTVDEVHEIAQGRVWTGTKALELGLVDELGDLHSAIQSAASLAGIDDYRITEYPRIKDPIQKLMEDLTGASAMSQLETRLLHKHFPNTRAVLEQLEYLLKTPHPQARLPFDIVY